MAQKKILQMRSDEDFKKRFDAACEFRGWKMQKALERIVGAWLVDVEREMAESKKKTSADRTRTHT